MFRKHLQYQEYPISTLDSRSNRLDYFLNVLLILSLLKYNTRLCQDVKAETYIFNNNQIFNI